MAPRPTRYRMFIDDTGNVHSGTSNHPQTRYAGITGVIFEWEYLTKTFEPRFADLKKKHFGEKPPILHLRKMKRAMPPFEALADKDKRAAWEASALSMYGRAKYDVITVGIDKTAFYYKHPHWTGDIYELLVGNAIERYFYYLKDRGVGDVVAEACNSTLDAKLKSLYRKFYTDRTEHIPGESLRSVLTTGEIKIEPKSADIPGLQMADLLASTCFSHMKRLHAKGPDYDVFAMKVAQILEERKFYRSRTGSPRGYGRVWRP